MAYCIIEDVRLLNPKRDYSISSKPTLAQVEALIASIAVELNTVLWGRGLSVPVNTPANFVDYLKEANAFGAAALAEMGMFPESAGVAYTPHGERLWRIYSGMVEYLKKGDLPVATKPYEPRSFFEQHETKPADDEPWRRPLFGRDKDY